MKPLREEIEAINNEAINALDWQIKSQLIVQDLLLLNAEEREQNKSLTTLPLLDKLVSNQWDSDCFFKEMTALDYLNQ